MRPLLYVQVCLAMHRPCFPARWRNIAPLPLTGLTGATSPIQSAQPKEILCRPIRYRGKRYWLVMRYTVPKTSLGSPRKHWAVVDSTHQPRAEMSPNEANVGALWGNNLLGALNELRSR